MVKSGDAARKFVTTDVREIKMKQGVLGVKVSLMAPGPKDGSDLPDRVIIFQEKKDNEEKYEKRVHRKGRKEEE